mgnify:CR=1 FL=1
MPYCTIEEAWNQSIKSEDIQNFNNELGVLEDDYLYTTLENNSKDQIMNAIEKDLSVDEVIKENERLKAIINELKTKNIGGNVLNSSLYMNLVLYLITGIIVIIVLENLTRIVRKF